MPQLARHEGITEKIQQRIAENRGNISNCFDVSGIICNFAARSDF
jgi:hypothetical protein